MLDDDTLRPPVELRAKTPAELTSELILQKAVAGDLDEPGLRLALKSLAQILAMSLSIDAVEITICGIAAQGHVGAPCTETSGSTHGAGAMVEIPVYGDRELLATITAVAHPGRYVLGEPEYSALQAAAVPLAAAISLIRLRQRLHQELALQRHAEDESDQARLRLDGMQISTEQSQLEEVLRAEQLRFNKVTATIPGAICTFRQRQDGTLSIPYASEAFEDLYGLTLADVASNIDALVSRVAPDDVMHLIEAVEFSAHTMKPWHQEYRYQHPRKGEIWLEGNSMPLQEPDGSILWHGFTTDVTERKRAEEAVHLAEQRYRRLFEGAPVMHITTLNQDGRAVVSACNQLFLSTLGYTRDEVIGQPLEKFYSPNSRRKLVDGYPLALKGKLGTEERELLCRDGRIIPTLFEAVPEIDADGGVNGTQASFVDITDRKQVETALSESNERFTQMAETIQEVFWMFDNVQQRLLYLSPAYEEIWGRRAEDTYRDARVYIDAIAPDDHDMLFSALARQANGEKTEMEYRVVRPDGTIRWIHDRSFPIMDASGAVVRTTGIAADITERKQAEIALRLSEEKYRGLMESLDSVIALVDADGRFVYMNDLAAAQIGGTAADLIGKTMHELFPEPVASLQLERVRRTIHTDSRAVYVALSQIQGTPRWHRTSLQPIHDEIGNVAYALVYSTDIHDLKTAQQELLELNRTLEERVEERTVQVQDLYENAPTGYHTLDVNGNFVQVNQTELNWFGYARGELIGKPFSDLVTRADQRQFATDFAVLMQDGWVRDLEYEMRRKDGSTFSALIRATAVFDVDQKPVASRFTVFDNTERKQAEIALRESEEQNRLLFEESPDASVLVDDDGRIVKANRAYTSLTKYSLSELVGSTAGELGLVADNTSIAMRTEVIQAMVRGDRFVTVEHPLRCADGSIVTVESRIFLLQLRGVTHTLVTSRDVSTRKQAEEALRTANAEIERAMRLKDEFLANVSHELRTPLSGVLALSETLQEQVYGPLNARQIASLRNIELSGRHLLSLINDLLDLSKIEAGKLELSLESVSVDDVCQASLVFVKEIAGRKQIRLTYASPDPGIQVTADVRRLKQMLVNLLSNAVKFTPEGGSVELRVTVKPVEHQIEFAVHDTGIGIAPSSIPRLFQPFSQLDSVLARQFEGTGLGLALVKRLAAQHGGSVRVESAGIPGLGSTFTIVIPYATESGAMARAVASQQVAAAPRREASACILLTEDNEVTADALTGYLEYLGYRVVVARTGPEALEIAAMHLPDVILMDIHLPQLDGLEVIRRLRLDPRFTTTPIVAVTALAMSGDRARCLAAGANEYLSKPVRVTELAATVKRLLES